jgi:hypothetical protein
MFTVRFRALLYLKVSTSKGQTVENQRARASGN